jgi:AraC-like DNA-binding protein
MKPQLLKVQVGPSFSFSVRKDVAPFFYNRWHYHPEVELIHIGKGTGTQFIGDHISRFREDDVLLVGSNLPHYWRCDERYFQNNPSLHAKATVVHFMEEFWGKAFLEIPENKPVKDLLLRSKKGIAVDGRIKKDVISLLQQMTMAQETERLILLLKALYLIAKNKQNTLLSSTGFQPAVINGDTDRINDIYAYSIAHFKEKITLEEIAAVAHISENSFCRYFKTRTRKTYSRFLQELRIGHACKLLIENRLTLAQVCEESGFNNFTNFYRYFKAITGKTPAEYQKQYAMMEI